jgi:transmembrane protein TMEM260 (protein O-mannosyltransferase)
MQQQQLSHGKKKGVKQAHKQMGSFHKSLNQASLKRIRIGVDSNIKQGMTIRISDEWIHLLLVLSVSLLVYIWSAPRTVVLEDDGYFILAAYFNGIAHPPGYPLYTLLSHVATWLPVGSVAFRVHVLSALFASLSCACLWWIVRVLLKERVYAYGAALSFAYSKAFWSQAIIAEVYTLNTFLFSLCIILCLNITNRPQTEDISKSMKYLLIVYGLCLSNHWPLIIISTPMLLAILWPRLTQVISTLPGLFVYLLIGLTPYIWMIARSQMDPQISFYGPLESVGDFIFYISREGYAEIDTSPSAGWYDKFLYCRFILHETANQFGSAALSFMILGLVAQWRLLPLNISLAILLGYFGSTFVLIGLLQFDYDYLHQIIFRVYPLVSYLCASIWIGLGLYVVIEFISGLTSATIRKPILSCALVLLISGVALSSNVSANYRSNDKWAENYATVLLNSLPEDAVLFLGSDTDVGPVGYMNKIEGLRDDVTLFHIKGQVFKNRLFRPFKVNIDQVREIINKIIINTDRPIYYTDGLMHEYGVEDYGLLKRVLKDDVTTYQRIIALPEFQSYFFSLSKLAVSVDPWEKIHKKVLYARACRIVVLLKKYSKENNPDDKVAELGDVMCENLQGKYIEINQQMLNPTPDIERIKSLLDEARTMMNQSMLKQEEAWLDYIEGEMYAMVSDDARAIDSFNKAILVWDHPENPAINARAKLLNNLKKE